MPRTRTYGLDIDTIRYAQRVKSGSGATILPEPLKQINKFVIGVKKLGLWNSMVCWPMRSIHNAGTGSTLYSLGGQGVFNGNVENSAQWGYLGFKFPITSSRILVSNFITPSNTTFQAVAFRLTAESAFGGIFGVPNVYQGTQPTINNYGSSANLIFQIRDYVTGQTKVSRVYQLSSRYNYCAWMSINSSLNSMSTSFNKELYTTDIGTSFTFTNPYTMSFGNVNSVNAPWKDIISHTAQFSINIDENTKNAIYDLYKRTLGIGLNLP